MSRRPSHATDCPACSTGWTVGDLLCPRCAKAVHTAHPLFYPAFTKARADRVALALADEPQPIEEHTACVAREAYMQGLIVGTAMRLQRPMGNRRTWEYVITDKGLAALANKKGGRP